MFLAVVAVGSCWCLCRAYFKLVKNVKNRTVSARKSHVERSRNCVTAVLACSHSRCGIPGHPRASQGTLFLSLASRSTLFQPHLPKNSSRSNCDDPSPDLFVQAKTRKAKNTEKNSQNFLHYLGYIRNQPCRAVARRHTPAASPKHDRVRVEPLPKARCSRRGFPC